MYNGAFYDEQATALHKSQVKLMFVDRKTLAAVVVVLRMSYSYKHMYVFMYMSIFIYLYSC